MARVFFTLFLSISVSFAAQAQVTFGDLSLRGNTLLFTARSRVQGQATYNTAFRANVLTRDIDQLSFYPERVFLDKFKSRLFVQNIYGLFLSDAQFIGLEPMEGFASFAQEGQIAIGKLPALKLSPDSRYLLYFKPVDLVYAELRLLDLSTSADSLISEKVEIRYTDDGFLWEPGSQSFFYSKGQEIHYYMVDHQEEMAAIPEEFRSLGSGSMNNLGWSQKGELVYINKNLIIFLEQGEILTRNLFRDTADLGVIRGRLPFNFNAASDRFWIAPNNQTMAVLHEDNHLFIAYLEGNSQRFTDQAIETPVLELPQNLFVEQLLWPLDEKALIRTRNQISGQITQGALIELDLSAQKRGARFQKVEGSDNILDASLSENRQLVALLFKDRVEVRDYQSWELRNDIEASGARKILWVDSRRIIVIGTYENIIVNLNNNSRRFLFLSQLANYGFSKDTSNQAIIGQTSENYFTYANQGNWQINSDDLILAGHNASNGNYRAYLESSGNNYFTNQIMLRNFRDPGGSPLFVLPPILYEPLPVNSGEVDFDYFNFGVRNRRREVALVFNCFEEGAGLRKVISILNSYGLKSTFFLNGTFIRQNPAAVQEIATTEHEAGSLFHVYFNLTDSRYAVDEDYIKSGLSRCEDYYYNVTGQELSLLWHTPYYLVNSTILNAAKSINYKFIGRDIDPSLWDTQAVPLKPGEIIEKIMAEKKPGSIIAIQLGKPSDQPEAEIYNYIDILINALLQKGYSIVPVSRLIEMSR